MNFYLIEAILRNNRYKMEETAKDLDIFCCWINYSSLLVSISMPEKLIPKSLVPRGYSKLGQSNFLAQKAVLYKNCTFIIFIIRHVMFFKYFFILTLKIFVILCFPAYFRVWFLSGHLIIISKKCNWPYLGHNRSIRSARS